MRSRGGTPTGTRGGPAVAHLPRARPGIGHPGCVAVGTGTFGFHPSAYASGGMIERFTVGCAWSERLPVKPQGGLCVCAAVGPPVGRGREGRRGSARVAVHRAGSGDGGLRLGGERITAVTALHWIQPDNRVMTETRISGRAAAVMRRLARPATSARQVLHVADDWHRSRPACPVRAGEEGRRGTSPEGAVRGVLAINPAVEGGGSRGLVPPPAPAVRLRRAPRRGRVADQPSDRSPGIE